MKLFLHRDRQFLVQGVLLLAAGFLMIASAGGPSAYAEFGNASYYLTHQLIFGLLPGIAVFAVCARIPYMFWRTHAWTLLLVSIALLTLVFIPGIRGEFGTSRSWINLGAFSLQPAEIVKLTFLFYLAAWLERRGEHNVRDVSEGLVPFLSVLGFIVLLLILQPDVGTMVVIAAMAIVVYYVAGASLFHLAFLGVGGVALLSLLIAVAPYRAARFTAYLDPEADPLGIGYHVQQALIAVGSGGWFGRGFGHSLQKFQYLPEVVNDSIFAVMAEELGFFFIVLFVVLYAAFLLSGFHIAERAPDRFGRYVVVGIVAWFGVQMFMNIGSVLGLLPLTGLPLPLISYGGTSLAISLGALGVLWNIAHYARS